MQQNTHPTPTLRQRLLSKKFYISAAVVVLVAIGIWAYIAFTASAPADYSKVTTPAYDTVLPENKTIESLGGWRRVNKPQSEPVFAYSDVIDTVAILVSQQPLPKSFHGDVDKQLAELANSFNATNKLSGDGIVMYVGTSAKGPQSTLLVKNNTLIMIKSEDKIKDAAWLTYATSLR